MNEAVVPKIYGLPRSEETSSLDEQQPTWLQLRMYEAYITNMAGTTTPPRTPINWTVVTGLCTVGGFILILLTMVCTATWFISAQNQHMQDAEAQAKKDKQELEERIDKAEAVAKHANDSAWYAVSKVDGGNGHAKKEDEKPKENK